MGKISDNQKLARFLRKKLNEVSTLTEHRLYREEQYSIDKDVLAVRNCLNWVLRINKLITHFKFSYSKALSYALKIKLPTEKTKEKDWYSFHLENCLFRLLAMWDIYSQLLNEFYDLGISKEDCSIWRCIKKLKNREKELVELGKKIDRYCNKPIHQYVRNDLRNSFAHSKDPHEMLIFHYIENGLVKPEDTRFLPDHPFKELIFVLNDFRKLCNYLQDINRKIEELMLRECILIKPYFLTECGNIITDGQIVSVKILKNVRDITEVSIDGQVCNKCKELTGDNSLKYCRAKVFLFHRIHEPDILYGIYLRKKENENGGRN